MPDRRQTPSVVRVPIRLIGPIWAVVAGVAGLWWQQVQSTNTLRVEMVKIAANQTAAMSKLQRLEMRADLDLEQRYTKDDAQRELGYIIAKADDVVARVRALEARRK